MHRFPQPAQCEVLDVVHCRPGKAGLSSDGLDRFLRPAAQSKPPAKHFRVPERQHFQSDSKLLEVGRVRLLDVRIRLGLRGVGIIQLLILSLRDFPSIGHTVRVPIAILLTP